MLLSECQSLGPETEKTEKKKIKLYYLHWLPGPIGGSVLFLCTAGSQATVNSHFGARDGNNITSHPSGGPDRGPDRLPESHYLISGRFTQRLRGGQRFMVAVQ